MILLFAKVQVPPLYTLYCAVNVLLPVVSPLTKYVPLAWTRLPVLDEVPEYSTFTDSASAAVKPPALNDMAQPSP